MVNIMIESLVLGAISCKYININILALTFISIIAVCGHVGFIL